MIFEKHPGEEFDEAAYQEGYAAYKDDRFAQEPQWLNPYCAWTQEAQWLSWKLGYYDAAWDD